MFGMSWYPWIPPTAKLNYKYDMGDHCRWLFLPDGVHGHWKSVGFLEKLDVWQLKSRSKFSFSWHSVTRNIFTNSSECICSNYAVCSCHNLAPRYTISARDQARVIMSLSSVLQPHAGTVLKSRFDWRRQLNCRYWVSLELSNWLMAPWQSCYQVSA